ncbi:carbohydrate-binding domain-containing protein [Heterostelium album PN500]|uniref:Carbohydrate-binding domain-containing protein n=1 Tax=Heterostelium pallidum (strain ATCC 26659 / Pp 5 / PN500) TaxID=670386 RepID=D3B0I2_HETP5|nr:carbohydrate-binding domain-containing protein [Heterostelium album PN500]EFA84806.1 carbohydrate-binding domain-containing protein [Heterostelium album PN500]|eukprot:XP_020436917.1 carbohydrate-binding domain-containing protein [Heterostelium album PN500]
MYEDMINPEEEFPKSNYYAPPPQNSGGNHYQQQRQQPYPGQQYSGQQQQYSGQPYQSRQQQQYSGGYNHSYSNNINNYPLPHDSPQHVSGGANTSPVNVSVRDRVQQYNNGGGTNQTSQKSSSPINTASNNYYQPTYPNLYTGNGSPRSYSRESHSPSNQTNSPRQQLQQPLQPLQQQQQQYSVRSPYQQHPQQPRANSPNSPNQSRQGAYQYPNAGGAPTVHYSPPSSRTLSSSGGGGGYPPPIPSSVHQTQQQQPTQGYPSNQPPHPYQHPLYQNTSHVPPSQQSHHHPQTQQSSPTKPGQYNYPPVSRNNNNGNNDNYNQYTNSPGYPPPKPSMIPPSPTSAPMLNKQHNPKSPDQCLPKIGSLSLGDPIPGAHGDGIHDDTVAVQAYFNNTAVKQFKIPPGTYLITSPICIFRDNVQLIGSPNVKFVGNFPGWPVLPNSVGFINWEDYLFYLQGDNLVLDTLNMSNLCPNSLSSSAILIYGSGWVMKNCSIDNFNQALVFGKITKSANQKDDTVSYNNIKIFNNKITNVIGIPGGSISFGDGICFFGCQDVTINNNLVSAKPGATPRNGINSGPEGYCRSTNIKYHNNVLRGDWDYPLTTEKGSFLCGIIERGKNIILDGNKIHITGRVNTTEASAITFYGVFNGLIKNNTIVGTSPFGIIVRPSHETGGGIDTVIEQNTIEGEFGNCIFMNGTDNSKIRGNVIFGKDSSGNGIHLWQAKKFEIHENNVDMPKGTACLCSGANDVMVRGNTMMSSLNGFYIGSQSNQVTIENNDLFGVTQSKFGKSDDSTNVVCEKNFGLDK